MRESRMKLERLLKDPIGGNPNGGHGWVDWMTKNYCTECRFLTIKGTTHCPRCHSRVRMYPRGTGKSNVIYKKAQSEAAAKLKKIGWKLPPATIGRPSIYLGPYIGYGY